MKALEKVLIVDDDSTARFLIERTIRKVWPGPQVLTAANGEEALALLNQIPFPELCPELILLDINMPLMDGFEFLQAIQNSPVATFPLRIVLLTSSNNPNDIERAKHYPIAGYLQKPLTVDKLQTILAA